MAAILDGAGRALSGDPRASMDEIARAAGTSRQTVYAHFPSREALLRALVERATTRIVGELEAADLDSVPALEGLVRLLDISWRAFQAEPFLLAPGPARTAAEDRELHQPVVPHLERLIRRGRREGDFDRTQPVSWMLAAITALGHAAGEEVHAGRLTPARGRAILERALARLLAA